MPVCPQPSRRASEGVIHVLGFHEVRIATSESWLVSSGSRQPDSWAACAGSDPRGPSHRQAVLSDEVEKW